MSDNKYDGLRALALSTDPAEVRFAPTPDLPDVFGVVCDYSGAGGIITLVCFADGATSVYYESGGYAIGLGGNASIAEHARVLVATVQSTLPGFSFDPAIARPPVGHIRLTAMTYAGPRTLTVTTPTVQPEDPGRDKRLLFMSFSNVITAWRLWQEANPQPAG